MPDAQPNEWAATPVVRWWAETARISSLRLALGPFGAQHRVPGQVLKLRVDGAGESYFALASAPSPDGHAEVLLKRGGKVADLVIERCPETVDVTAPFGRGFPVAEADGRDVLLFAAGSGIAPIRAVVQHVMAERSRFGRVDLFYGERQDADFAYRGEESAWQRAGVRVIKCASRPSSAWGDGRGHVQDVARQVGFGDLRIERAVAFVCGMKPMVTGVRELLAERGLAGDRVHLNF